MRALQRRQILEYTHKDGKKLWGYFNSLRDSRPLTPCVIYTDEGNQTSSQDELVSAWIEHFSKLGALDPSENQFFDPEHLGEVKSEYAKILDAMPDIGPIDEPITAKEILLTISKLRPGKAPGPDGIMNEFLKAGIKTGLQSIREMDEGDWEPSPFLQRLTALLNSTIASEVWPENWRLGLTQVLYKKGDPRCPGHQASE